MTFDHGILNTPLRSRGDIDTQIDAYKAAEARRFDARRKAAALEIAEFVSEAKAIVARITKARLTALGAPYGLSVSETRAMLVRGVRTHGERALIALRKEV